MNELASPAQAEIRTTSRSAVARRYTTRVLRDAADVSSGFYGAGLLALTVLWVTHSGPAWIAGASAIDTIAYAAILGTSVYMFGWLAELAADALDPDAFDGDVLFEMATSMRQLHTDIEQGADPDDVHDSLVASRLIEETTITVRGLSQVYAARGDEDKVQQLMAVILHLRKADEVLGYGTLTAALNDLETDADAEVS